MRVRLIAIVAVLALVGAACGNASDTKKGSGGTSGGSKQTVDQPGVTKDEIRVGGVATISNPLNAPYGDIFKGVKAYFNMVNSSGGLYGRKLKVVAERDDQVSNNQREVEGMLTQDNVFAALGMLTIFSFSGAKTLADQGVPSFGLDYTDEWGGPKNLFSTSGILCDGCTGVEVPYFAKQLGRKKAGILAYSVPASKLCAEGQKKSFEKYPSAQVGFYSDSLSFGNSDFSVEVKQMKDAGVDFVTTCMDMNAVLSIAKELKKQGVDAVQYLPNGYDQQFMKANGSFFEGSVVRVPFAPFETPSKPKGLAEYLQWMKKSGYTLNEPATYGWINAAMFVEGLKAAGPKFTRQKVVDALNTMKDVNADGLSAGVDWTTQHTEKHPPVSCVAYVKVVGGKFVNSFAPKGKTFMCLPDGADLTTKPTYK